MHTLNLDFGSGRTLILAMAFGAIFSAPSWSAEIATDIQAAISKLDCRRCLPKGETCDLSEYRAVVIVHKPKFEGYAFFQTCFGNPTDEACPSLSNMMVYSSSHMKVLTNRTHIRRFDRLSATYSYDRLDQNKWWGIYLKSNHDYLVGFTGALDARNANPEISIACEIND